MRDHNTTHSYGEESASFKDKARAEIQRLLINSLANSPDKGPALMQLGLDAQTAGRIDEAIEFLRKAVAASPDNHQCHYNLGNALDKARCDGEARQCYEKALTLKRDYIPAINNLASLLSASGELRRAEQLCLEGLALSPLSWEFQNALGGILSGMGRLDEAEAAYRRAVELAPDNLSVRSNLLLCLNYSPTISERKLFEEHAAWGSACERHAAPRRRDCIESEPGLKLRIGYVSADFRRHSVAYFIEPILYFHDRNRFEVFCYSDADHPDEITARMTSFPLTWRDIHGLDNQKVATAIIGDQIDILVDLGGHTSPRLPMFALKPAPVQATYLGYPNTTGLPAIDYRLTDEWTDPTGQEAFHTERLARIPGGFLCYAPLAPGEAPDVTAPPCASNGRLTFGSFNNHPKITDAVINAWTEVLHRLPNARLAIKNKSLQDSYVREDFLRKLKARDIEPERVEFLRYTARTNDHLDLYGKIDVALDTFPYNGTTTTCEALWMGVPVITLEGAAHRSRVGSGIMRRLGLSSFVAASIDQYIEAAVLLDRERALLASLRPALRNLVADKLCDGPGFVRRLERIYRSMRSTATPPQ